MVDDKRETGVRCLVPTLAFWFVVCTGSFAQDSQPRTLPDAPSASVPSQTEPDRSNRVQSGMAFFQLLERKSLVFPDLATDIGPLNPWQKFQLAANNSASMATFGKALIASTLTQAINRPAGYGQEGGGYGKRFGADMARSASSNLFGTFLFASVFHEDPRFYVRKRLSFKQSVKYAAVRVVLTRSDSGERVFDYSGVLGPLAGEALANAYYPDGSRGIVSTLIRYSSDLGVRFGGNLLRQYWPKINSKAQAAAL